MVRTRIGVRIAMAVGLVTVLTIGILATLMLSQQRRELTSQITHNADLLSETVKTSARDAMLENHRETLRRQIEAIGRLEQMERVRVFNKEGRIAYSSDPAEVNRILDRKAESCYSCHAQDRPLEKPSVQERARIFRAADGHRVLGIVNPIQNMPSCAAASCHAHAAGEKVLGVLDVTVSLADVDRRLAAGRNRVIALACGAILVMGLLLWWLSRTLIIKPVAALAQGTRRVAQGDLTTAIPVGAKHELGDLARAFNAMTGRLAEVQRQLTQADKLASVGRLAAGVAHEINNPLTGVLTYASFLLQHAGDDAERRQDLEVIVRETRRCREIVRGLLDFARQTPPRRQPTDLNDVARRAVGVVMNQLHLRHVGLRLDLADDLPVVPADANQMQQVLVNLIINASDAIGERGGTIRLSSRRADRAPKGSMPIRRAACPKGCDLLDPETRIGGLPSIRVLCAGRGGEILFRLDPVYGRANHLCSEPIAEGTGMEVLCPRCRLPLRDPARRCRRCGSATFAVRGPDDEAIHWCARKGCPETAWEACDGRGPVPVVELVVEDDGRGVPKEALARLFEPFFTTKGSKGTGLGLAITWGIVEGHGGTIEVESEVGSGSRFTVRLPLAAGPASAAPQSAGPPGESAGRDFAAA
jgi:two-component system NtrC family sensor kinase